MRLISIRHGQTEWNRDGREMGHLDSPLTVLGREQAKALARRLQNIEFTQLYSSDLGRAVETAEIIGTACGKNVQLDAGLRERHMGLFQGLTWEEMSAKYPAEREAYTRMGFFDVVPEGESAQERLERSVDVLSRIANQHPNETVVVVTHGGFLMGFVEFVLGIPPGSGWRFKRDNASFNAFEYRNAKWCLQTWNDLSHLDGLEDTSKKTAG